MIVKQTTDINEIKHIICNNEIYDCITDDNCPPRDEFEPPVDEDHMYIGGYVNNEIIAIMVYHKYKDGQICHVQVLPEFRKEYAIQFGEQSLSFRGTRPLYAEIPTLYPNVIHFAKLNGFKEIETIKDSHVKDGSLSDVKVMRFNDGIC